MSTHEVRAALAKQTGWSKQAISARVKRLQSSTPMSTSVAQAVLAHQQGVKIGRLLNDQALASVHRVLPLVESRNTSQPRQDSKAPSRRIRHSRATASPRKIVFPNKFELENTLLSDEKLREAREMAAVYPILYVLENSMRAVIVRVLAAKYGADWWNTALTNARAREVRSRADTRRSSETRRRWHQRSGSRPIDYTELGDLGTIILSKQDDFFPQVLGDSRKWFEAFMEEIEPSRNVVCHMNPLKIENARLIELRAQQWKNLLDGSKDTLPPEHNEV